MPSLQTGSTSVYDAYTLIGSPYQARVHDFFAVTLKRRQRISALLEWSNADADLNLFLMREILGNVVFLGKSDQVNTLNERVLSGYLEPGRYLLGVGAWKGSGTYKLTVTDPDKK